MSPQMLCCAARAEPPELAHLAPHSFCKNLVTHQFPALPRGFPPGITSPADAWSGHAAGLDNPRPCRLRFGSILLDNLGQSVTCHARREYRAYKGAGRAPTPGQAA